jgi:hypothetical protein
MSDQLTITAFSTALYATWIFIEEPRLLLHPCLPTDMSNDERIVPSRLPIPCARLFIPGGNETSGIGPGDDDIAIGRALGALYDTGRRGQGG